jgi:uncharacterized protein with von Willebrand factor type A (vWA) domain
VPDWTRKPYNAPGLTQIPPGPYLRVIQERYGGTVMLCIDVSGSMSGRPLREAVRGGAEFVTEAISAHYQVGVMLWSDQVDALAEPTADGKAASRLLARAHVGGGTNLLEPLHTCHQVLGRFTGDRVVALFGDGDLGPKAQVLRKVAVMKADDIRFVTRGLGRGAAREFGEISSEEPATAAVEDVGDLAAGIAGMARSLGSKSRKAR